MKKRYEHPSVLVVRMELMSMIQYSKVGVDWDEEGDQSGAEVRGGRWTDADYEEDAEAYFYWQNNQ